MGGEENCVHDFTNTLTSYYANVDGRCIKKICCKKPNCEMYSMELIDHKWGEKTYVYLDKLHCFLDSVEKAKCKNCGVKQNLNQLYRHNFDLHGKCTFCHSECKHEFGEVIWTKVDDDNCSQKQTCKICSVQVKYSDPSRHLYTSNNYTKCLCGHIKNIVVGSAGATVNITTTPCDHNYEVQNKNLVCTKCSHVKFCDYKPEAELKAIAKLPPFATPPHWIQDGFIEYKELKDITREVSDNLMMQRSVQLLVRQDIIIHLLELIYMTKHS